MAHIIVFGNEKGGSGKSTTAMHVLTALLRSGKTVGALDLDLRQKTLTRYIQNRILYIERTGIRLPFPETAVLKKPSELGMEPGFQATLRAFQDGIAQLDQTNEFIVADCPGNYTQLSELTHAMADTLVTPMNDSFVDFDLLARIDGRTNKVTGPSIYSEMVWKARKARAETGSRPMNWFVTRNRMHSLAMKNKRRVGEALEDLARRIGFTLIPGFSDRVIFKELFPNGLTLLDLFDISDEPMSMSNLAARQEVRDLVNALGLPDVEIKF